MGVFFYNVAGTFAKGRWSGIAGVLTLAFALTFTVFGFHFWYEAWSKHWLSDTMWRARLWIPYSSMPIGLALLTLQCVADIAAFLTGREPPFGMRTTSTTQSS